MNAPAFMHVSVRIMLVVLCCLNMLFKYVFFTAWGVLMVCRMIGGCSLRYREIFLDAEEANIYLTDF